jgi:hypothetical protein
MNIVHTIIHIVGEKEELDNFKNAVKATIEVRTDELIDGSYQEVTKQKEVPFAFQKIIPIPEGKTKEELRNKNLDDDWFVQNWGSFGEPFDPYFEEGTDTHAVLCFDTKAGFPERLYVHLVGKFPNLKFYGTSWEEMGHFEYKMNGPEVKEVTSSIGMARMEAANDDVDCCMVSFSPSSTEDGDSSYHIQKIEEDDITGFTFRMTEEDIINYNLWNEAGCETINDDVSANDDVEPTDDPFIDINKTGIP